MAQWVLRDRVLLSAVVVGALLFCSQLVMTLLQPPWYGPVTYWFRAAFAWLALLLVVAVSRWLSRARRPQAAAWWMLSAALLCYAIAQTLWTVEDQFIFHHEVPFPGLPDLFFLLQYPFFLLGILLVPRTGVWGPHVIMLLDGLLLMGAATALSWYFLLAPLARASGLSPLARAVSLAYPAGDLVVLFGLTTYLLRPVRYPLYRPVGGILVVAFVCLIVRDSWAIGLLLMQGHVYRTGGTPHLFRVACYLLIVLAALVLLRLAQHAALWDGDAAASGLERPGYPRSDLRTGLRLFLPIVAGLLAGTVIALHAIMTAEDAGWQGLIAPLAVAFSLLLLVIIRQWVAFLETARLRRELEVAWARELAQVELDGRKDEFLSVVSHELRTPLASLQGFIQLLARRIDIQRPHEAGDADTASDAGRSRDEALLQTALGYSEASVRRLTRLADDLVDDARIRHGQLDLHVEPCDLGAIVRAAVEEQRALEPDRTILLDLPANQPTPVCADADRIEQVVTNYLTNALKYSQKDRPVVVRLETESGEDGDQARVSVRDEGPGLSAEDQAHVWERFPRIEGVEVQSGSGVSLGLGLQICKAIVEGHHGHVGVHSSPGHGSTFWFTLPLARPSD